MPIRWYRNNVFFYHARVAGRFASTEARGHDFNAKVYSDSRYSAKIETWQQMVGRARVRK